MKAAPKWRRIGMLIFGICSAGLGGWYLVGDYMLPHKYVVGVVDRIERPSRLLAHNIYINGRRHHITCDLLNGVGIGERLIIEYGVGSASVFRVRRDPQ